MSETMSEVDCDRMERAAEHVERANDPVPRSNLARRTIAHCVSQNTARNHSMSSQDRIDAFETNVGSTSAPALHSQC
jgi:hypothetical protein